MNVEKLREIQHEIYKELYRKAIPRADFDKLFESGYFQKERNWRNEFNIPSLTRRRIIDGICIKHNCTLSERRKIGTEVSLGFAPRDRFEKWQKNPKLKIKFPEPKKKKRKILKLFSWFVW
jgi:hypothetical protein